MAIRIPYGKTHLALNRDLKSLEVLGSSVQSSEGRDEDAVVLTAMANPIGGARLTELARGKSNAVLIISDHTRPVPSKRIVPHMLAEMRAGNPDIDITLLVATGFHRGTTKEELVAKLGGDIVNTEKIVIHDCNDDTLVDLGELPSGARLIVNRLAAETELLVAEGFIEPHFFAGFSGGRKSVMPGVCSRVTVLGNHCAQFINSEHARAGVLDGNPIHRDMVHACGLAKLQYIVNVIIDEEKKVVSAYAGDAIAAHEAGCNELLSQCRVTPEKAGDIVITSNGGAPLDQNVYQAVKGLSTAESAANHGAVLIMCAECLDGTGSDDLYHVIRDMESPQALLREIGKVPMNETRPDQWEYQILARILERHTVIFVSRGEMRRTLEDMSIRYAPTLDEAIDMAHKIKGPNCHHVVIPDGIAVIVA